MFCPPFRGGAADGFPCHRRSNVTKPPPHTKTYKMKGARATPLCFGRFLTRPSLFFQGRLAIASRGWFLLGLGRMETFRSLSAAKRHDWAKLVLRLFNGWMHRLSHAAHSHCKVGFELSSTVPFVDICFSSASFCSAMYIHSSHPATLFLPRLQYMPYSTHPTPSINHKDNTIQTASPVKASQPPSPFRPIAFSSFLPRDNRQENIGNKNRNRPRSSPPSVCSLHLRQKITKQVPKYIITREEKNSRGQPRPEKK